MPGAVQVPSRFLRAQQSQAPCPSARSVSQIFVEPVVCAAELMLVPMRYPQVVAVLIDPGSLLAMLPFEMLLKDRVRRISGVPSHAPIIDDVCSEAGTQATLRLQLRARPAEPANG